MNENQLVNTCAFDHSGNLELLLYDDMFVNFTKQVNQCGHV